jgi:hypothetical protein
VLTELDFTPEKGEQAKKWLDKQLAEQQARDAYCQSGPLHALSCGQSPIVFENATVGVSGGGFSYSGTVDSGGNVSQVGGAGVMQGMEVRSDGSQKYSVGGGVPKAYAQVCVVPVGAKPKRHSARLGVSSGILGASTDGTDLCGIVQTPAPPEVSLTVK